MKNLKNNFTTPEQSKRLLELGVPADSADCYYSASRNGYVCEGTLSIVGINMCIQSLPFPCVPSWSVGRLMEIIDICCAISDYNDWCNTQCVDGYVAYIIGCYERATNNKQLDFSKLEE